jgi:hypothetical protein
VWQARQDARRSDRRGVQHDLGELADVSGYGVQVWAACQHRGEFLLRAGEICVADPLLAKEILTNPDGPFREHSDSFQATCGIPGSRASQTEIGRLAVHVLDEYLRSREADLPALVERYLTPSTCWPDTGNLFAQHHQLPMRQAPKRRQDPLDITFE